MKSLLLKSLSPILFVVLFSCQEIAENPILNDSIVENRIATSNEGINFSTDCEFDIQNEIPYNRLKITSSGAGSVVEKDGYISISKPKSRAVVKNEKVYSFYGGIKFRYNGPSDEDVPLASGAMRRQIGLKLRAKNTCNLLYVMWRIEPEETIIVAQKSNPGMDAHSECLNNGYTTILTDNTMNSFPPSTSILDGEYHTLIAKLESIEDENNGSRGDDFELTVCADNNEVWRKKLYDIPIDVAGVSGFRTDNGHFDLKFYSEVDKGDNSWFVSYAGKSYWSQLKLADVSANDLEFGDFNGDGKTDIFKTSNGKWYVSLGGNTNWTEWNTSNVVLDDLRFGDFDGDGKTDVFRTNDGKWLVSLEGKSNWTEWGASTIAIDKFAFGDFNGDRKTDIFRASMGKWYVSLGGKSSWTEWNTSNLELENLRFGDFDGDGKTDIFRTSKGKWLVSLEGKSSWIEWNTSIVEIDNLGFGDFNGDGKIDIFWSSNGKWNVSLEGKSKWKEWGISNYNLESIKFGDFDGDNKTDIFRATKE